MKDLQTIAEDVELAERFACCLRFHEQPERADEYEAFAEQQRETVLAELPTAAPQPLPCAA